MFIFMAASGEDWKGGGFSIGQYFQLHLPIQGGREKRFRAVSSLAPWWALVGLLLENVQIYATKALSSLV